MASLTYFMNADFEMLPDSSRFPKMNEHSLKHGPRKFHISINTYFALLLKIISFQENSIDKINH